MGPCAPSGAPVTPGRAAQLQETAAQREGTVDTVTPPGPFELEPLRPLCSLPTEVLQSRTSDSGAVVGVLWAAVRYAPLLISVAATFDLDCCGPGALNRHLVSPRTTSGSKDGALNTAGCSGGGLWDGRFLVAGGAELLVIAMSRAILALIFWI